MSNRFKMNRIGFVNFWLYDEEEFEFEDGKLLLRGQNASGKSITTQSFIPFILDGDRTPSRLDPFGSSDRRMEYYFLGEEGKDESTGYLFLELKKEGTEEYRTIGIGQRAKRGKPMDFWGFVILDGRRVGTDVRLYKEVGSSKIPLDRREMKAELGEDNYFTTSQSEYKKYVNQYIFGFRRAEQYEQFIRLLVKVRAPKLSKEFKPTKVYDILNDSLQTLTDEDLRTMVDAMEKMDEIQDSLEMLTRAFNDVKIIRNEYTRYNQYMLAKKAQAYLSAKEKAETEQERLKQTQQEREEAQEAQRSKTLRLTELKEERRLKETERDGLLDTDLEEMDRKLEQAKREKEEAAEKESYWEEKARGYQEQLLQGERRRKEIKEQLEQLEDTLFSLKEELEDAQEILQWDGHRQALQALAAERYEESGELLKELEAFRRLILECRKEIQKYEEIAGQYDVLAEQLEKLQKRKAGERERLTKAQEAVVSRMDEWISAVYEAKKISGEWKPADGTLKEAEERIREYGSAADAAKVQELLRMDYERQRQELLDEKNGLEYEKKLRAEEKEKTEEELVCLRKQEELEPKREEDTEISRAALQRSGIAAVPFYKAVEFAEGLGERECARLEAQLGKMGILDALVVAEEDFKKLKETCPEFLDTVLYAKEEGNSSFARLIVREDLENGLKKAVLRILGNIYEDETGGRGIYIGKDGSFGQGILAGKADKRGSAEFVGALARKRRREQKISELERLLREAEDALAAAQEKILRLEGRMERLQKEYQGLPGFSELDAALEQEKSLALRLRITEEECAQKEEQERILSAEKNLRYQEVLQKCRHFPYGRTAEAYEEAAGAAQDYGSIWNEIRQKLLRLENERRNDSLEKDRNIQAEDMLDAALGEKRSCSVKAKECDVKIRQCEEYLNRPDIAEKAARLSHLKQELEEIDSETEGLKTALARLEERLERLLENEPRQKESLQQTILVETFLRTYFEEELALKLVIDRGSRGIPECAQEALRVLREADRNREATEMLQSLHQVYQRHNGSLVNYGTSLEDCFDAQDPVLEEGGVSGVLRKRVRVVSAWNGKRVYLEAFYGILKQAIDETELLIRKKDRELFEDILSQTISRQLTDRIAESRKWVSDMSQLMKEMDTSMGLIFSLDWKPRRAENDSELDTAELEQILLRDRELLTIEDIEKVAAHFRSRIRFEKQRLEEDGGMVNYMELVRDALDYRKWFEFHMYFRRGEGERKLLTNAAFNRFSGGEKAMAMYVPLFAAVNAQYKKAEKADHPRMIALDEAFAGVDDKNISSMFELVHKLDFDYIMNSQALWGCFDTVKGLRIAELSRPQDSQVVSVIRYTWNGHERILDVQ